MAVTQVGTPNAAVAQVGSDTPSITPAFSGTQTDAAGDYLIIAVSNFGLTGAGTPPTPSGWTQILDISATNAVVSRVTIFGKKAAGSDVLPAITATNTGTATNSRITAELFQFTGQDGTTPVVAACTATATDITGTALSLNITSAAAVPSAGCYALTARAIGYQSVTTGVYTPSTGWTNSQNDLATSLRGHAAWDIQAAPASGSAVSDTSTWTGTTKESAAGIIVIQPAAAAGAVLQPRPLVMSQAVNRAATF